MGVYLLEFPTARFAVDLPDSLADSLRGFYPRARRHDPANGSTESSHDHRMALRDQPEEPNRWQLLVDDKPAGRFTDTDHALLAMEYRLETLLIASCHDKIAFHAGAVDVGGHACLFAGTPDAGKTSSTFQLLELGHVFVAEEIAVVEPETGVVLPYPQSLSLDPVVVREFCATRTVRHGTLFDPDPAVRRYVPERIADAPVPVSTLTLPRYQPREPAGFEEIAVGDVVTEILGYCFEPTMEHEVFFEHVISLLERWRLLRFTYGDTEQARRLLEGLFPPPTR